MKVAIVSSFWYHLECAGFLIELLQNSADIYITGDPHRDITYFKSVYNCNVQKLASLDENKYDFVIKLSSDDTFNIKDLNKQISILHMNGYERSNTKYYITLAPPSVVNVKSEYTHILPVYKGLTTSNRPQNTIIYIGAFADNYLDDDLVNFIKECSKINYNFIFCVNGTNIFVNTALFEQFDNVTVKCKISTPELIKLAAECKFLLCRKYPYQSRKVYSGAISIGLSHNIPFIMQQEISELYGNIPCMAFKTNYSELLDKLAGYTDIEYDSLKNEVVQFKNEAIETGRSKIHAFLEKIKK